MTAAAPAPLDVPSRSTPAGGLRRTMLLEEQLDRAFRGGASVILEGPGVSDLLITEAGQARRVLLYLAGWAADYGMATLVYSLSDGSRPLALPGTTPLRIPALPADTPPTMVVERLVGELRSLGRPGLLVVDFAELLVPHDAGVAAPPLDVARLLEQLAGLGMSRRWADGGHRLVLIARTGPLDTRLTRLPGFVQLTVGLPDETERAIFLRRMSESTDRRLHLEAGLDVARAARLAGGVLLDDLDRLRRNSSPDNPMSTDQIVDVKTAALRRLAGATLEILTERLTFAEDVAGMPQLRLVLREARVSGNTSLRLILAGPAGNGKTWAFTALASELGVPAVRLAQIRAPYVGQAEDNMDRALNAITVMAPCALLIDECDEAGLGHRSEHRGESSEVNANLRAKLFGWLGDTGSRLGITVIGTTNRPDRLDPASLSRFSLLPVLHPTASEAAMIMRIQATREGLILDLDATRRALAEHANLISGRLAVGVVDRAHVYAAQEGRRHLTGDDVRRALADSMGTLSPADEHAALLAVAHTTWVPHLPWVAAHKLGMPAEIPGYMAALLDSRRRLDMNRLRRRLAELERASAPDG